MLSYIWVTAVISLVCVGLIVVRKEASLCCSQGMEIVQTMNSDPGLAVGTYCYFTTTSLLIQYKAVLSPGPKLDGVLVCVCRVHGI